MTANSSTQQPPSALPEDTGSSDGTAVSSSVGSSVDERLSHPRRLEITGWPLLIALGGAPVWWVLGLTPFVPAGYVVVTLGLLAIAAGACHGQAGVRLPDGVLPLLGFVGWALICAVMIDTGLRLVGFGVRWISLVALLVVILHIANSTALTERRLLLALVPLWLLLIVGGYLGILLPDGGFSTPVSSLLPSSIARNDLVEEMLSPRFAEVQKPWGAAAPFNRPSAPFAYTNGWGCAFALLTPMMLGLRRLLRTATARAAILIGISASLVPAVMTRNRGMLLMVGVALLTFIIGRLASGDLRGFVVAMAGAAALVATLAALDVKELIAERAAVSNSAGGRAGLYSATAEAVLESPLLGFGAPRPSLEIEVALGTQGAFWMYLFSYGVIGAALFVVFLAGVVRRSARLTTGARPWAHATVAGSLSGIFFYGLDSTHLLVLGVVCGLLLRSNSACSLDSRRSGAPAG